MARTATAPTFAQPRLKPPATLTPGAKAAFVHIVRSVAHDHFSEVDVHLVAEYARAVNLADQAAAALDRDGAVLEGGKVNPWLVVQEKSVRAMTALCARLRLSPQSRFDRLVAGTKARPQRYVWERDPLLAQAPDDGLDEYDGLLGR